MFCSLIDGQLKDLPVIRGQRTRIEDRPTGHKRTRIEDRPMIDMVERTKNRGQTWWINRYMVDMVGERTDRGKT